jgi:hypothetical protein
VLVIHGIGQQRRFETLSEFAHGLLRNGLPRRLDDIRDRIVSDLQDKYRRVGIELFQDKPITLPGGLQIALEVFRLGRKFDSRCKLVIPSAEGNGPGAEVDLYEAYWAPLTGGRTNFFRVVWWLTVTAFRGAMNFLYPLEPHTLPPSSFRRDGADETGAAPVGRLTVQIWKSLKELVRLILVFILLIVILLVLYLAGRELWTAFIEHGEEIQALSNPLNFVKTIVAILYLFLTLQYLGGLLSRGARQPWYQWLPTLGLLVVAGALIYWGTRELIDDFKSLILLLVVLWVVNKVFVEYLGDVEVYTSGSDLGRNQEIRREIIEQTSNKLGYILYGETWSRSAPERRQSDYHEVVIVGHSLGSVIAYDVLCDMLRKEGGNDAVRARARIRHLFTVGSPLDKIWYFFRERPDPSTIIHQGILARLKGVKASGIDDSPLSDLSWTNLWCWTDWVSGPLQMYGDQIENAHIPSLAWLPLVNHVKYWTSVDVMRRIGERVFTVALTSGGGV